MLSVHNLCFDYEEKPLLTAVNFQLEEGGVLHLRGANGVGKTTLLKLLAGLLQPLQGQIVYREQNIQNELAAFQSHLCYVGHKSGASSMLTIREHYQFELQHISKALSFDELMQRLSLSDHKDTLIGLLSAGLRRRVGLAKLLLTDAPLWLLDEPLVALDQDGIDMLMRAFNSHLSKGGQMILTSHQLLPNEMPDHQEYFL